MPNAHMDFGLTKMLARTKSNDGHVGAFFIFILLHDDCALYSMSSFNSILFLASVTSLFLRQ